MIIPFRNPVPNFESPMELFENFGNSTIMILSEIFNISENEVVDKINNYYITHNIIKSI